ncbi:nucleic acid-binding, OB-fold, replication protein A, OB domain protein [Tanacetum coccineum]
MDSNLTNLSQLTPFRDDWKIKVRVIRLWKLPDFKNPLVTYSLEMVLMDEEAKGQCYYLSDFGVTERKAKHHVVAHKYRINFYHITKVDNCDDIGGSLFGFDFRPFESVRSEVQPSTVTYDVIGQVVSCGSLDYPLIEGRPVDEALGDRTKLSILIMQFAKHKIYRGCRACNFGVDPKTEEYKDEESGLVKKKTVIFVRTNHAVRFKIQIRVLDNTGSVSLTLFDRIANALLNKEANELVEKQLKDGAIDVLPEDFNDLLEKKLAFKVDITDYNLSKNKYVYGVSQICQEADVIEELELKVPTLEATVSSSLTPSLGFISPPSRLKYQWSETGDTSSLIESLKDTGTSPIKRKLEDVIDVEELSNASSTKKKPLAPKIEKD